MSEIEPRGYVKIYKLDQRTGIKTLFREFHNQIFAGGRRELAKLVVPAGFGIEGKPITNCQLGVGGTGYGYSFEGVELNTGVTLIQGGVESLSNVALGDSGFRVKFSFVFNDNNVLYEYLHSVGDIKINEVSLLLDYPNRESPGPTDGRMFCGKDFNSGSYPFNVVQFVSYIIEYEIRFDRFPSSISSSGSMSSESSYSDSVSSYSSDSSGSSFSSTSTSSTSTSSTSTSSDSSESSESSESSVSESSTSESSASSVSSESSESSVSESSASSISSESSESSVSSDSSESSESSISSVSSESSESSTIPWWFPKELEVDVSTIEAGELKDVYVNDDIMLEINEQVGTPGFEYHYKFHDVPNPEHVYGFTFWGYYGGGPGHFVKSQIYDFDLVAWDDVTLKPTDFPSQASKSLHNIGLPALGSNYWNAGDVWIKITHVSSGVITHNIHNDLVRLSISSSVSSDSSESSLSVT